MLLLRSFKCLKHVVMQLLGCKGGFYSVSKWLLRCSESFKHVALQFIGCFVWFLRGCNVVAKIF